jgi:hypothetical protein
LRLHLAETLRTEIMTTLLDLFDNYGSFKRAVRAPADGPVSPAPGNGQDTAPLPDLNTILEQRRANKAARKTKEAKSVDGLPDKAAPAPVTRPLPPASDVDDDILADDSVIDMDGEVTERGERTYKIRKLPSKKPFRVMPGVENQLVVNSFKLDPEDRRPNEIDRFVVSRKLKKHVEVDLQTPLSKSVVRWFALPQGQVFLTMVNASSDLDANSYNSTMRTLLKKAETQWVFKVTDTDAQEYTDRTPTGNVRKTEPKWPKVPILEAFKKAIGKAYIDTYDHPILKRLRGEDGTEDEAGADEAGAVEL